MTDNRMKVAAELVRCSFLPSYYAEDMPKTTPKSVLRQIEKSHRRAKELAKMLIA